MEVYTPSETVGDPAVARELQRISQVLATFAAPGLAELTVEPGKPFHGQTVICDGSDWDPLGDGVRKPVWYDANASAWKAYIP